MNRLVLAVFFFVVGINGTQATALSNPDGRTTISLDGMWNAIVDPYEIGVNAKFFTNAKPKTKSDLIEYDFDRSGKLRVPALRGVSFDLEDHLARIPAAVQRRDGAIRAAWLHVARHRLVYVVTTETRLARLV